MLLLSSASFWTPLILPLWIRPRAPRRNDARRGRGDDRRHGDRAGRGRERFITRWASRAQRRAQLVAMHHHVDHAVLQQIFGALEAFRQLLADRLRNDARAGEADLRAGLGDLDVAQHGIGRADAADRSDR